MSEIEHKAISLHAVELKADDDGKRTFSGYASVFNGVDAMGDTILPGAYSGTLKNRDRPVLLRWNHHGGVIGKFTEIREDSRGLFVKGELTPDHSTANDVYASLKHGAIDGMSIGYRIPPGGSEIKDGIRYLKEIELVEISIVEMPADLGATVASVKDVTSARELERALREKVGLSKRQAKRLLAEGHAGLAKSDAEDEAEEMAAALQSFTNTLNNISRSN